MVERFICGEALVLTVALFLQMPNKQVDASVVQDLCMSTSLN